jgi:hypothetical protein
VLSLDDQVYTPLDAPLALGAERAVVRLDARPLLRALRRTFILVWSAPWDCTMLHSVANALACRGCCGATRRR